MKKFAIIYNFSHSKMGFQNQITVDAIDQEQAIENAKKAVSECYGSLMLKRFTFKLA